MREKVKVKEKFNWPVTILLMIGLITIIFPLYMTIVIAFKQPSEMTNSVSGFFPFQGTGAWKTLKRRCA